MLDLSGKCYAVFGVANEKSICWAIARALMTCGADVVLVSHPMNEKRIIALAAEHGLASPVFCDVADQSSVTACFDELAKHARLKKFDGAVHGIAFSDKKELEGRFIDTTQENFTTTLLVSSYSLVTVAHGMEKLLRDGGSIITLSFDAVRGTYPNYNVMGVAKAALETAARYLARDLGERGIRVNVLSPSPEDTLSARGISNFRRIGDFAEAMSPLGRRATLPEIGNAAAFLLSDVSSGMTGQTMLVDCGASSTIMPPPRNAAKMAVAMSKIAEIYEKEANNEGAATEVQSS